MTATKTEKKTCPLCHKTIKADAEVREAPVLNRGVPETAPVHVKCFDRDDAWQRRAEREAGR